MTTVVPMPSPVPSGPVSPPKKKKDKVRSAWISFAGRIIAQVMGAGASVALTLVVLHQVQTGPRTVQDTPKPLASASAALPASGEPAVVTGPALAVLPLDNFSGDPAEDAFADGMTEALVAELAQVRGLTVISRTSAMRYRGAHKPLPEIARELGATHLIEGSLVTGSGRVRVTAQLIEAASDRHVWAHSYDRPARDVLAVQAEVARTIAEQVGAVIEPSGGER